MIEMRWLKYETSRQSPIFGPEYKQHYQTKRLQYRYLYDAPDGAHWSEWQDVPTVEAEAERAA